MTECSQDASAHPEAPHMINRANWLRAAVLGANDGIVSVSALIVGVAAADPSPQAILIAGAAGLAAGAMSMAAGEYVSVSSQSDIERADIARERQALIDTPAAEEAELASIYRARGLSAETAALVARVTPSGMGAVRSKPATSCPARARLAAIGPPILPNPMKPICMSLSFASSWRLLNILIRCMTTDKM